MFNSIRTHQYLNDYMKLIDLYYKYEYRVILSNYYLFDHKISVFDKEILYSGAYERIGDLTGYKWIKVYYFPVAFSQQAIPRIQTTQYGVTKPTETVAVFPRINFTPTMLDFITFYLQNEEVEAIYQISNYEISYIGNKVPIYKVVLKMQFFELFDVARQVSSEFCYFEPSDKIYEPQDYNNLILATTQLNEITSELQQYKENSSGLIILNI